MAQRTLKGDGRWPSEDPALFEEQRQHHWQHTRRLAHHPAIPPSRHPAIPPSRHPAASTTHASSLAPLWRSLA